VTDFSTQQIRVDLFFSDPLYVSLNSTMFDEVVVRMYKTFFARTLESAEKDLRDLHWDYNQTDPRGDYYELRSALPPQVGSETEAVVLQVTTTVVTASLVIAFVLPASVQIAIRSAMNKMWSVFNTLQILTLLNLMAVSYPGNVSMVFDQIERIVQLEFIPKDKIFEFLFGEPDDEEAGADVKDLVLKKAGFKKDNLMKSIFLFVVGLVLLAVLIGLVIWIGKKCFSKLPDNCKKVFLSLRHMLMYNSVLRMLLQSYLPLCVSTMVSLKYSESSFQRT